MEKKKICAWLPYREGMTSVSYGQPGALVESVRNPLVSLLKNHPSVDFAEMGDFRTGFVMDGRPFVGGKPLGDIDAFVWFGEIGRDHRRDYNLALLKSIERGAKVVNCTQGYEIAMDKYLTSSFLAKNGVRVPRFALLSQENAEQVSEAATDWGAVLLKPRLGSYGVGIMKLDRPRDLVNAVDYCPPSTHYLEQMIPNDPAQWVGVNIIGGKHAYSYRKGPESFYDGWKVMDRGRVGGKMLLAAPSDKQVKIAEKVAKLLGMAWVGVDIITGADGKHYVIDANAFPGLYPEMFAQAKIDGPKMMADAVFKELGV